MAEKMKKYQFARPYQSYEFMDVPDSLTVRCPDGSSIEMSIGDTSMNGEQIEYDGENPFVNVWISYGIGNSSRRFTSEDPQSTSAYITVMCERSGINIYDDVGVKRATMYDNPTIEEVISKAEEMIADIWDYAQDYAKIEESAKKSKKVKTMAKNKAIRKETEHISLTEEGMDIKFSFIAEGSKSIDETVRFEVYAEPPGTGILVNCGRFSAPIADIVRPMMPLIVEKAKAELIDAIEQFNELYASRGWDFSYTYDASTKKSMNKSKYSDIHKRLAKLGGFTKDEEEIEIDDDDVVEIEEEDGDKKVEIESKEEHAEEVADGEESEDDNLNECNRTKSKKTVKGMRTSKKRMKMAKGEDMPADADDFQNDNQKGSGNAGKELPEDADEQQDINEKGSGNAGSELPEDADEQENIKESARKARIARMRRSANKSVNRPPVRKFSVTNGGQPNQESYNGRYQQAPMVRDAIDGHMSSRANKSFDEIAMMNERIANIQKAKRNPSGNNGVPKKIR